MVSSLFSCTIILLLSTCCAVNAAIPAVSIRSIAAGKIPAFYLAGDSTTATQSSGGGGWGDGFLSLLTNGATGKNYGHNGATTVSFMQSDWRQVMANVSSESSRRRVFVTIQFGHNDQKKDRGISDSQFSSNLQKLAGEVKAKGGTPILVTPLTRRQFSGSSGPTDNLARQRQLTLEAAKNGGFLVINLNDESRRFVKAIGESGARQYNLKEGDNTHLNKHGSLVFGRMVADLILGVLPDLKEYFKADDRLSTAIKSGKAV